MTSPAKAGGRRPGYDRYRRTGARGPEAAAAMSSQAQAAGPDTTVTAARVLEGRRSQPQ
jgi:hypothetical protein